MKDKKIAVIIVTWNARESLLRGLDILKKETKSELYDLFIVDNGSTDGTFSSLQTLYPDAWLWYNQENVGFARGVNIALKHLLKEKKYDYILLLNADVELQGRALENMLAFLEQHGEATGVGPALILPDYSYQAGAGGYLPSLWTAAAYFFGLSRIFPRLIKGLFLEQKAFGKEKEAFKVDWISGACLLVRSKAFDEAGLLDESFFFSGEDIEWCWRLKKKGMKLFYLPEVKVIHHHGATRENLPAFTAAWIPNLLYLIRREKGKGIAFLIRLCAIIGFFCRLLFWTLINFTSKNKFKKGLTERKLKEIKIFFRAAIFASSANAANLFS
jgi:GT2 family glycosyltransferase